jgi:hypothetical protein
VRMLVPKTFKKHLDICMYCSLSVYETSVYESSLTQDAQLLFSICEPSFARTCFFLFQSDRYSRRLFSAVIGSPYLLKCAEYSYRDIPERSAQKQ